MPQPNARRGRGETSPAQATGAPNRRAKVRCPRPQEIRSPWSDGVPDGTCGDMHFLKENVRVGGHGDCIREGAACGLKWQGCSGRGA